MTCPGYQWMGQTVCHCDGCGKPRWEHEYDCRPTGEPFSDRWRRVYLSKKRREWIHLRWCFTMLVTPRYCRAHDPSEYGGMTPGEITKRLVELAAAR